MRLALSAFFIVVSILGGQQAQARPYSLLDVDHCVGGQELTAKAIDNMWTEEKLGLVDQACVEAAAQAATATMPPDAMHCDLAINATSMWYARRLQDIEGLTGRNKLVRTVAINATLDACTGD